MTRTKHAAVALALALALVAVLPCYAQQQQQQASLYKRLGGYDAIAAVTDDFLARMTADPQLKRFFGGLNEHAVKRVRQHIVDFLCQTTGGPCAYHGLDMKTAHTGLKITENDWNQAVKLLTATLDKFNVKGKERDEVMAAVSGLKPDIVGQ